MAKYKWKERRRVTRVRVENINENTFSAHIDDDGNVRDIREEIGIRLNTTDEPGYVADTVATAINELDTRVDTLEAGNTIRIDPIDMNTDMDFHVNGDIISNETNLNQRIAALEAQINILETERYNPVIGYTGGIPMQIFGGEAQDLAMESVVQSVMNIQNDLPGFVESPSLTLGNIIRNTIQEMQNNGEV